MMRMVAKLPCWVYSTIFNSKCPRPEAKCAFPISRTNQYDSVQLGHMTTQRNQKRMSDQPHVMPQGSQPDPMVRRSRPDVFGAPAATSMAAVVVKLAI